MKQGEHYSLYAVLRLIEQKDNVQISYIKDCSEKKVSAVTKGYKLVEPFLILALFSV